MSSSAKSPANPYSDESETRPFNAGRLDRRNFIPREENPFVAVNNRKLWEEGWDYENQLLDQPD